jgi:hypothetical protein
MKSIEKGISCNDLEQQSKERSILPLYAVLTIT